MDDHGSHGRLRLRAGAASWREVDGETIVLDLNSSLYLGVNPSGTLLWNALVEGATRDGLVEVLVDAYGVDAEQAATDVDAFVSSCRERDLLEA